MTTTNDSGQALLEIALCLSLLMLLVMGTMDVGYLFSTKLTLQNAVRQAGRYAITGQCITGSDGTCSESRYNSVIQTAKDASLGLLTTSEITLACGDNGGGCPNSAGGPGDTVTITVTYPYHFMTAEIAAFFPHNFYTITVSATFTNEMFPPSES